MAFNYQTLKKLTNAAVIADEVKTADIGSLEVKSGKIAANSISSAKIGTGAVGLNTDTTTSTLPTNKGGSGITSIGTVSYTHLRAHETREDRGLRVVV